MECQCIKAYLHLRGENTDGGGLEELAATYVWQEPFICMIFGKITGSCSRFFVDFLI